jgi:hypothetical protein
VVVVVLVELEHKVQVVQAEVLLALDLKTLVE